MTEKISIDQELLQGNIESVKNSYDSDLNRATYRLDEIINSVDAGSSVNSPGASLSYEAMAIFLGTYKTFKEDIGKNGLFKDVEERDGLLETMSYYAGAVEALESIKPYSEGSLSIKVERMVDFMNNPVALKDALLKTFKNNIESKAKNGQALIDICESYFKWVMTETRSAVSEDKYKGFVEAAKQYNIQINNAAISGFSYRSARHQQSDISGDVSFREVVGNIEGITKLKRTVDNLLHYDIRTKKNRRQEEIGDFAKTLTLWGEPGQGKTTMLKAVKNYAEEKAEQITEAYGLDKPIKIISLSNAFKNEFYSKSAQTLKENFDDINKGDALYIVLAEDIDMVFYSRNELENRPEDKANLEVLMNALEGITSSNRGNYIFIATTNRPFEGVDNALATRLREGIVEITGPETVDDYSTLLFDIKLCTETANGYISVNDSQRKMFGKKCQEYGFSGRDVKNIAKQISDLVQPEETPLEAYNPSDLDEFKSSYTRVTSATIGKMIDQHYKNIVNSKEKSEIEMINRFKAEETYRVTAHDELVNEGLYEQAEKSRKRN